MVIECLFPNLCIGSSKKESYDLRSLAVHPVFDIALIYVSLCESQPIMAQFDPDIFASWHGKEKETDKTHKSNIM